MLIEVHLRQASESLSTFQARQPSDPLVKERKVYPEPVEVGSYDPVEQMQGHSA